MSVMTKMADDGKSTNKRGAKASQCDMVLRHLRIAGGITTLEAFSAYGITRLASRICDIKKLGYRVGRQYVTVPRRDGGKVRVVRYTLEDES